MMEEEAKDTKRRQYEEEEKKRRSRIKEFCKIAGGAVVAIVAYALGKKSNSDKA